MKQTDWATSAWLIWRLVPAHPGRQRLCSASVPWQLACFHPQLDKLYSYPFAPSLTYSVAQFVAHPPVRKCQNKKTIHCYKRDVWYKMYPKINLKKFNCLDQTSGLSISQSFCHDAKTPGLCWNHNTEKVNQQLETNLSLENELDLPCKLPQANFAIQRCISVNGCTNLQR